MYGAVTLRNSHWQHHGLACWSVAAVWDCWGSIPCPRMNDEEIQAFLDRPFTAVVATVGRTGNVHSVPVWYRFAEGSFRIWTDGSRAWVKNARRHPQMSVAVAEHEAPFAAVIARGTAEVLADPPGMADEVRAIVARYIPEAEVDAYIAPWSSLRTIVRIEASGIRAWGRGY